MRNAGRDHATLLPGAGAVVAVVALAAGAPKLAAQQPAAQAATCTTIADDVERLACYDRALRAASPQSAAQAPAAPTPAAPPVQTPIVPAPAPQAAASPQRQADADKDTIAIVIVGVRTVPGRETVFTAQDGTTWVQTDSQRVFGLPETPFDAEIKPGAMGSRFLVPSNGARAVRVRSAER